jgi:hypothetical protein
MRNRIETAAAVIAIIRLNIPSAGLRQWKILPR